MMNYNGSCAKLCLNYVLEWYPNTDNNNVSKPNLQSEKCHCPYLPQCLGEYRDKVDQS